MVGPKSKSETMSSTTRPGAAQPALQIIAGMWQLPSYIDHFWLSPWSLSESPWSEVKMTMVLSSTPRRSSASKILPTWSSIRVTLVK